MWFPGRWSLSVSSRWNRYIADFVRGHHDDTTRWFGRLRSRLRSVCSYGSSFVKGYLRMATFANGKDPSRVGVLSVVNMRIQTTYSLSATSRDLCRAQLGNCSDAHGIPLASLTSIGVYIAVRANLDEYSRSVARLYVGLCGMWGISSPSRGPFQTNPLTFSIKCWLICRCGNQ
jgi:hypothetical protein